MTVRAEYFWIRSVEIDWSGILHHAGAQRVTREGAVKVPMCKHVLHHLFPNKKRRVAQRVSMQELHHVHATMILILAPDAQTCRI